MPRSHAAKDARSLTAGVLRTQKNALQATQLATASAAVIGRRLTLGQAALHDPIGADHGEFVRMVAEKGTAAMAAGAAAIRRQPAAASLVARFMAAEAGAAVQAGLRVATARTPAAAVGAQWQYAGEAAARAWSFYLGLGRAMAEATGAMTAPVLRTAAANARRLG